MERLRVRGYLHLGLFLSLSLVLLVLPLSSSSHLTLANPVIVGCWCEIEFDRADGIYHPGDPITITLRFYSMGTEWDELAEPDNMEVLVHGPYGTIDITGDFWRESTGVYRATETVGSPGARTVEVSGECEGWPVHASKSFEVVEDGGGGGEEIRFEGTARSIRLYGGGVEEIYVDVTRVLEGPTPCEMDGLLVVSESGHDLGPINFIGWPVEVYGIYRESGGSCSVHLGNSSHYIKRSDQGRAELKIISASSSKTPIYVGDKFCITAKIKNVGDGPIWYISPAGVISFDPEDGVGKEGEECLCAYLGNLEPGESADVIPLCCCPEYAWFRALKPGLVKYTIAINWGPSEGDQEYTATETFSLEILPSQQGVSCELIHCDWSKSTYTTLPQKVGASCTLKNTGQSAGRFQILFQARAPDGTIYGPTTWSRYQFLSSGQEGRFEAHMHNILLEIPIGAPNGQYDAKIEAKELDTGTICDTKDWQPAFTIKEGVKLEGTVLSIDALIGGTTYIVRSEQGYMAGSDVDVHAIVVYCPGGNADVDPDIQVGDRVEVYGYTGGSTGGVTVDCSPYYIKKEGKPDLVITDIWFDDHTIYYTIKNIGDAPADTHSCISCFYSVLYIDGSGEVDRAWDPDLDPGESYTNYFSYEWHCSGTSDRIRVVADAGDYFDESNENNNSREETWQCPVSPPDLIVEDISWSPSSPDCGDTVTITVRTKNQGTGDAGSFYVSYYVDGTFMGRDRVSGLSAGSSTTTSFTWTASEGSHQIRAVADSGNEVVESDEGNNERTETLSVICPKPDLTISSGPTLNSSSIRAGDRLDVRVDIKNIGQANAAHYVFNLYISKTPTGTDGTFGEQEYFNTAPGAQPFFHTNFKIPESFPPGNYYVVAKVDTADEVDESNENNNIASTPLTITAPSSDYRTDCASDPTGSLEFCRTVPAKVTVGAPFSATVTLTNTGTTMLNLPCFSDKLPSGFTPAAGAKLTNFAASVDAGRSVTFTYGVTAGAAEGTFTITGTAKAAGISTISLSSAIVVVGSFTGSNFSCACTSSGRVRCSLQYNNQLGEKAQILFLLKKGNGEVADHTVVEVDQGSGTAEAYFDCPVGESGTYCVSWRAYRKQDTTFPLPFSCFESPADVLSNFILRAAVLEYDANMDGKIDDDEWEKAYDDYLKFGKISKDEACAVTVFHEYTAEPVSWSKPSEEQEIDCPCEGARTRPDLIIKDMDITPEHPTTEDTITIDIKVKNQGSGDASNFYVSLYADGTYLGKKQINGLAIGATTIATFTGDASKWSWIMQCDVDHTIKAVADSEKQVKESDEDNNEFSRIMKIECKPAEGIVIKEGTTDANGEFRFTAKGHDVTVKVIDENSNPVSGNKVRVIHTGNNIIAYTYDPDGKYFPRLNVKPLTASSQALHEHYIKAQAIPILLVISVVSAGATLWELINDPLGYWELRRDDNLLEKCWIGDINSTLGAASAVLGLGWGISKVTYGILHYSKSIVEKLKLASNAMSIYGIGSKVAQKLTDKFNFLDEEHTVCVLIAPGSFLPVAGPYIDNFSPTAKFEACGSVNGAKRCWLNTTSGATFTGLKVDFDASLSEDINDGIDYLLFDWDFGDGMVWKDRSVPKVTHTYLKPGSYKVQLTVRDPHGASDVEIMEIYIEGEQPKPKPTETSCIVGHVWDEDGNPIARVHVVVSGPVSDSDRTDSQGEYEVDNLPVGSGYTVSVIEPSGYKPVSPKTDISVNEDSCTIVNFTLRRTEMPEEKLGSIRGKVTNNNGQGIRGIIVRVSGPVTKTKEVRSSSGRYRFDDLPIGSYTVSITNADAKGYETPSPQSVVVEEGKSKIVNFELEDSSTQQADLRISRLKVEPKEPCRGQLVNVNLIVKNSGRKQARGYKVSFYLSSSRDDTSSIPFATKPCPGSYCGYEFETPPGKTEEVQAHVTIPDSYAAGTYWVVAKVDSHGRVEESREDNNVDSVRLRVSDCSGRNAMIVHAECPVDLRVTDPDGLVIDKQSSQIPGATYTEEDLNGDGDPDDEIVIPDRKPGNYSIKVIPEPRAKLTDTYALEISTGGETKVLAEDTEINDLPDQAYVFAGSWIRVESGSVATGDTVDVPVILSDAPKGLKSYKMTVSLVNGSVANIEGVTFAVFNNLARRVTIARDRKSVTFTAIDFASEVEAGAMGVTLAIVTFRGLSPGTSDIQVQLDELKADDGSDLTATTTTENGTLTVGGTCPCPVPPFPDAAGPPQDLDGDGLCEDVNGNNRLDFDDAVRLALNIQYIEEQGWESCFDFNHNGRIDFDDAVRLALGIGGASAAQRLLEMFNQAELKIASTMAYPNPARNAPAIRFTAEGQGIAGIKVEVFDLSGKQVFASDFIPGNALEWHLETELGQPVANGVYLYIVTVRGYSGDVVRSKVRKLVVLR